MGIATWKFGSAQWISLLKPSAVTRFLPAFEKFELASQLRRAASSVAANIAESNSRVHRGEYVHHLSIARGSLAEVETHLEAASRLEYVSGDQIRSASELCSRVGSMLTRLIISLRKAPP